MTEEEAMEYLKNCLNDEYNFKNATRKKDKECYEIILNLIQKQDTEINKLKRELDEMANTLDLNLSLSIENYKFGKKEKIKDYFMKENTGDHIPRID